MKAANFSLPLFLFLWGSAFADSDSTFYEKYLSQFAFFPQYSLRTDVSGFALQKDSLFERNYLVESNHAFEFTFLSYKQLLYSIWDFRFQVNLGEIPGNVVFTVLAVNFTITPSFEYRTNGVRLRTGMEHRCFHEVDRKEYQVVHWNRVFLNTSSDNFTIGEYWHPLAQKNGWTLKNRLAFNLSTSYYLKDFLWVDPTKINGNNPRILELQWDTRYAVYRRRSWVLTADIDFATGAWDSPGWAKEYWQLSLGSHSFFRRGKQGVALYAKYILDNLPVVEGVQRFSKDQLLEFGISFFN